MTVGVPEGMAVCPVCSGTGIHKLTPEESSRYWGNPSEMKCQNCGGQTMSGVARGYVRLNKDGKPCVHRYVGKRAGRCYTQYFCTECGDRYDIDSGD